MLDLIEGLGVFRAVALAVLAAVLGIAVQRRYLSSISDVPGPFWGSFSLLWQLYKIFTKHTERATHRCTQEVGSVTAPACVLGQLLNTFPGKFVRISHNEVSISDPAAVRDVLQSQMDKANWYKIFSLPDSRYVNTMSETDHREMVRQTRNVAVGYSLSNIVKGESHIDGCISLFRDKLNNLIKLSPREGVQLDKWVNYLAFDIVGESTFSKSFGFLQAGHDIGNSISNQFKLRLYICIIGHYYFLHDFLLANPLIAYFNLQPSMHIFDTCMAAVESRSKNTEARNDMIEQWQAQYRTHPNRMKENEILAAAVANMGAGADTVFCILQAFFYYLLRDKESLTLLREEIDHAELSDIPSYAELRDLPVLGACMKEAYRMHTPVGFGIPRVSNGATVCGRYFQPGVILSVSPWVIHRQESVFGADPELHNARRWLATGEEDEKRVATMEKHLIAYGSGYGTCPGKNLAHLEMLKTTSLVLRDFTWKQIREGKDWKFETYFTSVPHDWPVVLERRWKT